jgi:hypothetical protein
LRLPAIPVFLLSLFLLVGGVSAYFGAAHSSLLTAVCFGPAVLFAASAFSILVRPARWKTILSVAAIGSILCVAMVLVVSSNQNLRYHDALANWKSRKGSLTVHFPPSIPSNAKHVFLRADGKPLLSTAVLELSYQVSPEDLRRIEAEFSSKTKRVLKGTSGWTEPRDPADTKTPPIAFYTRDWPHGADLPSEYRVYVIHYEGWGYTRAYSKGNSYGIAVSAKRNQVIYWATEWLIS